MKILFLDVDGVLNSYRSLYATGFYGHIGDKKSWKCLDPIAFGLIKRVCEDTNTKVVLSSTWRMGASDEEIRKFGEFLGVDIISVTPRSADGIRGGEILQWLSQHPGVTQYAIIDDDSDMLDEQLPYFVKTGFKDGMLFDHYDQLLNILSDK